MTTDSGLYQPRESKIQLYNRMKNHVFLIYTFALHSPGINHLIPNSLKLPVISLTQSVEDPLTYLYFK